MTSSNLCQTLWESYDALKQAYSGAERLFNERKNCSVKEYNEVIEKLSKTKEDYNKLLYTNFPDGSEIYTLDYLSIIRLCDVNEVDLNEILAKQDDSCFKDRRINYLDLSSTKVSDLSPLAGLTNLKELWCYNTKVSDLTPLAELTNLQKLWCSETQVSDLAPIAGLINLQDLLCTKTQVSDLALVAGLTNLRRLTCYNTQVSDLTPLEALSKLTKVIAQNNKLNNNSKNLAQQKGWKI